MFEHCWNSKQVKEPRHQKENGNYVHNDGLQATYKSLGITLAGL